MRPTYSFNTVSLAAPPPQPKSDSSPRVLVLVDAFPVLSETFIVDHVAGMAESGFHVTVIARNLGHEARSLAAEMGNNVCLTRVPSLSVRTLLKTAWLLLRRPYRFFNAFSLRCALHAGRLRLAPEINTPWDAVHAHFGNNAVVALLANPDWRERLLVNFHGHDITAVPKMYGWWEYRKTLTGASIIVHSAFAHRQVGQNLRGRTKHVRLGVDCARFFTPAKGDTWPTPLNMLIVARLVPEKGVLAALDALSILRIRLPKHDVRLRIVGAGPLENSLRRRIESHRLADVVEGPAPTEYAKMPQVYACGDLLLMPSQIAPNGWQETFGRTAIEAMAAGLPIVGCRSGGLPETIANAGVIAQGFNGRSLADAVELLINSGGPREWAARSSSRVQGYSIQTMVADYVKATRLVMSKGRSSNADP